jgi:cytochrome c oxidase cbb3-type subunit 3
MQGDLDRLEAKRNAAFASFKDKDVLSLSTDPSALSLGHEVFLNNCAGCHGADAHGAIGFPNLTDNDWLYGGDPDTIVQTITNGRRGAMPAFNSMLSPQQVQALVDFVPYWSDPTLKPEKREAGMKQFMVTCAPCHGADGKGNHAIGSANLTDDIWLYGGSKNRVRETILFGRNGNMPAWGGTLSKDEIRVVAAYVYSLSHTAAGSSGAP